MMVLAPSLTEIVMVAVPLMPSVTVSSADRFAPDPLITIPDSPIKAVLMSRQYD